MGLAVDVYDDQLSNDPQKGKSEPRPWLGGSEHLFSANEMAVRGMRAGWGSLHNQIDPHAWGHPIRLRDSSVGLCPVYLFPNRLLSP